MFISLPSQYSAAARYCYSVPCLKVISWFNKSVLQLMLLQTRSSLLWSKATSNNRPNVSSVSILMVKGHKIDLSLILLPSSIFCCQGLQVWSTENVALVLNILWSKATNLVFHIICECAIGARRES